MSLTASPPDSDQLARFANDRVQPSRGIGSYIDHHPSRAAWVALLCSLILFSLFVYATTRASLHFMRASTLPAWATLSIPRRDVESVLVQQAHTLGFVAAQDGLVLHEGDELRNLDPDFPVTLKLFDGTEVRVQPGALISIDRLRTGRFALSGSLHRQVTLTLLSGTLHLVVAPPLGPGNTIEVRTFGTRADLQPGEYDVQLIQQQVGDVMQCCMTEVVTRRGVADVSAAGVSLNVEANQRALTPMGGLTLPPQPAPRQLLANSSLATDGKGGFLGWSVVSENDSGGQPGSVSPISIPGATGIHIVRTGSNVHGETGLHQDLNLDAKNLVSLSLEFQYRILYQSLPGGGREGTEYPLIVRVMYDEASGGSVTWYHGFYVQPASPEDGTRISEQATGPVTSGSWQTYDGDLLDLVPRPTTVRSVEILGTGWNYEVDVARLSITGI